MVVWLFSVPLLLSFYLRPKLEDETIISLFRSYIQESSWKIIQIVNLCRAELEKNDGFQLFHALEVSQEFWRSRCQILMHTVAIQHQKPL